MKKLLLLVIAVAGFCALGSVAQAGEHYRRSREVYIIEGGRPVCRTAYFDDSDRCYTYYGPRRVYVRNFYTEYPAYYGTRSYHRRYYRGYDGPRVNLSFGLGF